MARRVLGRHRHGPGTVSRAALALLVGGAAGVLAATQPVSDTDLFWHLATARETLAHGLVRTDVFSWTVRGQPVAIDQWLGQLVLYGAYVAGAWRGIAILRIVLVAALLALVVWNVSLRSSRPLGIVLAAMPSLVLTRALWVDRPELLGVVCFALLLALLRLARDGSTRALAAGVVLVAVWANIHGSFALGAVLVTLVCLEGAAFDRARRGAYALAIAGTALASIATPAGIATWTAPGIHLLSPPRDIQEWALIDPATPLGIAYVVTLGLVVVCALFGPRVPLREMVVLLPVAALSLTAARQAPLLAIAAAPLFAQSAAVAIERLGRRGRATEGPRAGRVPVATERRDTSRGEGFGRAPSPITLARFAPAAALFAIAIAIAPSGVDERAFPRAALPVLPAGDGVLARYEWGGWLIWNAPATPVFVDGRLVPYRVSGVLDDYRRVVAAAPGWEEVVSRRGVRALLVTPADPVAVRARELGWHVIATSDLFVLIAVP